MSALEASRFPSAANRALTSARKGHHMMSYSEAAKRALVTFMQAFLTIVIGAGLTGTTGDLSTLKQAALAGLIGAATFLHRSAQAWLEARNDA